jgi:hypothetical protein
MTSESFESSETVADVEPEVDLEVGPDGGAALTVVEESAVELVADVDAVNAVDDGDEPVVDGDSDEESVLVLEEASLPEAVLPVWEPTGNAAVDAALEDLHALADTDVNEHAAVYEKVQASLRATLDGLVSEDEPA